MQTPPSLYNSDIFINIAENLEDLQIEISLLFGYYVSLVSGLELAIAFDYIRVIELQPFGWPVAYYWVRRGRDTYAESFPFPMQMKWRRG